MANFGVPTVICVTRQTLLRSRTTVSLQHLTYRHILQDWDVWLSKKDSKGNDVNLHIENIYMDELQQDGLLIYERIKVLCGVFSQTTIAFTCSDQEWPLHLPPHYGHCRQR